MTAEYQIMGMREVKERVATTGKSSINMTIFYSLLKFYWSNIIP
jgi:hypothetical protein